MEIPFPGDYCGGNCAISSRIVALQRINGRRSMSTEQCKLPTSLGYLSASNPHRRSGGNWRVIRQRCRSPNSPTIHQFIPTKHADIMKNSPKFIGLSDSRLFHMRGVAYKSYNLAREVFNMEDDVARGLFLMGLTQDFAYAFVENQTDHEHEGGRILELSGFNWADSHEVFWCSNFNLHDWLKQDWVSLLNTFTSSYRTCQ